mmetsp:Transcript_581/g.1704  ORF Transcript_581/g.1704 Transcript_581/m.1704 type:complete len:213 (-) Transcript_581:832-1470(-)
MVSRLWGLGFQILGPHAVFSLRLKCQGLFAIAPKVVRCSIVVLHSESCGEHAHAPSTRHQLIGAKLASTLLKLFLTMEPDSRSFSQAWSTQPLLRALLSANCLEVALFVMESSLRHHMIPDPLHHHSRWIVLVIFWTWMISSLTFCCVLMDRPCCEMNSQDPTLLFSMSADFCQVVHLRPTQCRQLFFWKTFSMTFSISFPLSEWTWALPLR